MSSSSRTTLFYIIFVFEFLGLGLGLLAYCNLLYKMKTGNFFESTIKVEMFKLTKLVLIISSVFNGF